MRRKADEPKEPVGFKLEDVKGDKLTFVEAPRADHFRLEHPLIAFACPAGQYEQVRRRHLSDEGPGKPAPIKSSEAVVLYVLWGDRLGDPVPEAIFDRKAKRIVVTATWSGRPLMDTGTLYRGYGFILGLLEAGEYSVWVREALPVDKQGPKLTMSYTFGVEPREAK